MKSILITGTNGTLGPVVAKHFNRSGWRVVPWDRHQINPDDPQAAQQYWEQVGADAVCHLAMGSEQWAGWLAGKCAEAEIPFLFTSSVMVFASDPQGPYGIYAERNSQEGYGQYKIRCEDAIWQANPNAMIARLGWQIGDTRGGNHMLEHLWRQHEEKGEIKASELWIPASSRMEDTALGLMGLIERNDPGFYHFDSNVDDQWSFYHLVTWLKRHFDCPWTVKATQDYVHDQRLVDERIKLPAFSACKPDL